MGPEWRLVGGLVLAVAVPAAVLHFGAGADRLAAGLTAVPFAWPRLLVVHLVTALPVGLLAARWVHTAFREETNRPVYAAAGVGAAVLGLWACPTLAGPVLEGDPGETPPLVLRTFLAALLVFPWCVAAALDPPPGPVRRPGLTLAVCLAAAVLLPGVYADGLIRTKTKAAEDYLQGGATARAARLLDGLCELGSERPLRVGPGERPAAAVRKAVASELARAERAAARPLPADADRVKRLQYAEALFQLDRLDDAAAAAEPLAGTDPEAMLVLATVRRLQERWAESDGLYEAVLARLLPEAGRNPAVQEVCQAAFTWLAANARMDRRPADAERALRRGLEALPGRAAYFHFQLGEHYQAGGRPGPAREHFTESARLNPERYGGPAAAQIRDLRTQTPVCLFPTP